MEPDSSQSVSPSKKERDATVEAVNHLIQGKRHLLVQDFSSAVNSLQEACALLAACYGDLANECGDAYFYYGRALLELSRKESGIFGASKDESGEEEGDDDDDEDEEEEGKENDGEEEEESEEGEEESKSSVSDVCGLAANGNEAGETLKAVDGACVAKENSNLVCTDNNSIQEKQSKQVDSETKSEDLDDSKKADEEVVSAEAETKEEPSGSEVKNDVAEVKSAPSTSEAASASTEMPSSSVDLAKPGPSGEQSVKKDESEEISNLQLAWEVLELAKIIFKRQAADNRDMQLRLAQVHSKLGEVAMESENYAQSKEDLEECLQLQRPLLEKDDRQLAETFYQLGLVYTLSLDYDAAVDSFKQAIDTISCRIENLNKITATNAPPNAEGEDPVFHAKLELAELEELLPELQEKVTDTLDLKRNTVKVAEELKKEFVPETEQKIESTSSPVKENKPITNIGHLVRKKRKPENDASSSECELSSKKIRPDEESNITLSSTTVDSLVNGNKKVDNKMTAVNSEGNNVPSTND